MRKLFYKNSVLAVYEDDAVVKGRKIRIVRIREKDIITIIPVLGDGRILVERGYRPVIKKWLYELPAGHIEKGESVVNAARRELREETGYTAKDIRKLYTAHISPGSNMCRNTFLVAKLDRQGRRSLDDDEDIKVVPFDLEMILDMIRNKKIVDNKTISAILYYVMFG